MRMVTGGVSSFRHFPRKPSAAVAVAVATAVAISDVATTTFSISPARLARKKRTTRLRTLLVRTSASRRVTISWKNGCRTVRGSESRPRYLPRSLIDIACRSRKRKNSYRFIWKITCISSAYGIFVKVKIFRCSKLFKNTEFLL